jgi:hypothetical protein
MQFNRFNNNYVVPNFLQHVIIMFLLTRFGNVWLYTFLLLYNILTIHAFVNYWAELVFIKNNSKFRSSCSKSTVVIHKVRLCSRFTRCTVDPWKSCCASRNIRLKVPNPARTHRPGHPTSQVSLQPDTRPHDENL